MDRRVSLRPATKADNALIRQWLHSADIEAWWGPASATFAEVTIAMQSGDALCRIIECDGEPVGYCHAIDASAWGEALPDDLEPGTWDLDIFVASERHRGTGIGQTALAALKQEVFETTLAVAVCVFPSIRNERAVRAYEKAGFTWRQIWNDPHLGHSWFMVADRPR
jgi:RimJ/RimL family protein N-acetyltransferase